MPRRAGELCALAAGPEDQPASSLAIAEMGSGQQPAAVIICQRSEALAGDDDPSPVILSRFAVRKDTVRTLAWEPLAGERVVRTPYTAALSRSDGDCCPVNQWSRSSL